MDFPQATEACFSLRLLSSRCFSATRYCVATTGREFHWSFCVSLRDWRRTLGALLVRRKRLDLHAPRYFALWLVHSLYYWLDYPRARAAPTYVVTSPGHAQPSNQIDAAKRPITKQRRRACYDPCCGLSISRSHSAHRYRPVSFSRVWNPTFSSLSSQSQGVRTTRCKARAR